MLRIQTFVSTLEEPLPPGDRRGCSPSQSPAPSPSLGPRSPPEAKSRHGPASGGQLSNRGSPINHSVVSAVAAGVALGVAAAVASGVASPSKPSKGPRRSAANQSPRRAMTPGGAIAAPGLASGASSRSPARGSLASGSSIGSPARGSPYPSGLGRRSAEVKCWTQMYLLWEQQLKELHAALAAAAEAVCIVT